MIQDCHIHLDAPTSIVDMNKESTTVKVNLRSKERPQLIMQVTIGKNMEASRIQNLPRLQNCRSMNVQRLESGTSRVVHEKTRIMLQRSNKKLTK